MATREHGSGSYRRRGNGSWQLTVRDGEGNRHTRTVHTTKEAEVKRMLRDFLASVRRKEIPKAKDRPTVAQLADMWLEHKLKINRLGPQARGGRPPADPRRVPRPGGRGRGPFRVYERARADGFTVTGATGSLRVLRRCA